MEEDTGKLTHGSGGFSEVDLNRAGIPLMEIVSDPDTITTMLNNNYAPGTATTDELVARIHRDYATTKELIRTLKISLE